MKIDITDIIERDGAVKHSVTDVDKLSDRNTGSGKSIVDVQGVIHIEGEIYNHEGILDISAQIFGQLKAQCYRCLEDITAPFSVHMEETFERANGSKNLDNYEYSGHILDISQAVIDSVYLNIPYRMLCKSDCKGLCPKCGSNLNQKECGCIEQSEENGRFSALKDLFKE